MALFSRKSEKDHARSTIFFRPVGQHLLRLPSCFQTTWTTKGHRLRFFPRSLTATVILPSSLGFCSHPVLTHLHLATDAERARIRNDRSGLASYIRSRSMRAFYLCLLPCPSPEPLPQAPEPRRLRGRPRTVANSTMLMKLRALAIHVRRIYLQLLFTFSGQPSKNTGNSLHQFQRITVQGANNSFQNVLQFQ